MVYPPALEVATMDLDPPGESRSDDDGPMDGSGCWIVRGDTIGETLPGAKPGIGDVGRELAALWGYLMAGRNVVCGLIGSGTCNG